ncbi:MAG TPA: class II D-tagatose-bisphosphate aldolase, non-catalytic subunit [Candidatus Limnocylindrales bacterium]
MTWWAHEAGGRDATSQLLDLARANRAGERVGIYSVCSADRSVLQAAMIQAQRDGVIVLIEATSNQVNQLGGYTGMTPPEFRSFVHSIAADVDLPPARIVLGGDHLGPHVWRSQRSDAAMGLARDLVRDYVLAGFTKIHLDASMRLADDPSDRPLDEATVAERAADLCAVAEQAAALLPAAAPRPVYVVGSEVPIPGGELADSAAPAVTGVDAVERTLDETRRAFTRHGVGDALERVLALVTQPGVEFGDAVVFEYDERAAAALASRTPDRVPLIYEAHSTDYQTEDALGRMVRDHFAVLKVGPGLTFALREVLFALEAIEGEWLVRRGGVVASRLRETLQRVMVEHPEHWQPYFHGDEDELRFARDFSFSDRSRYYWPQPEVQAAVGRLVGNLSARPIPLTLLSQYLPMQYRAVREGTLSSDPRALIRAGIAIVIDAYAHACGMGGR